MVEPPIPLTKSSSGKGETDSSQRLFLYGDTRGILQTIKNAFFAKSSPSSSSQKSRNCLFPLPQFFDGNEKLIKPYFGWLLEG